MGAQREIRPPGVYAGPEQVVSRALDEASARVAGFVGLAVKGPLGRPTRIASWEQFQTVYGNLPTSYLGRAVEGFFLNGGEACHIVRIAHRAKRGELPGPEHAACAELVVTDGWNKPTIKVSALNEGHWGNQIWVRFEQRMAAKTLLTLDLELGAGEARLNSARGFERGALVRIYDRENSDYVVLTEIEDRMVRWAATTPLNHRYKAAGPTYLEVVEFDVFATLKDRREAFRGLQLSPLSRRYAPRVVSGESTLIQLEDLASSAPLPHCLPQIAAPARLQGGRDGIDVLTADDFIGYDLGPDARTGLMALAPVEEVAIVCAPDAMLAYRTQSAAQAELEVVRIQDAIVTQCENLKDRIAILDMPPTADLDTVRRFRRRLSSSYAAVYYPWLSIDGSHQKEMLVPPSGHLAGMYARCEREVGVHKAPANEPLKGVLGLSLVLSEAHLGLLNEDSINALRVLPGRGVRAWGARTTSDDPSWKQINVRRLFIMLRRSLEQGTHWAVFEPNSPVTWERLEITISNFLKRLWERGYFAGDSTDDSFFVRCDESTNPADVREAGQLVMEVGVAPAVPAEYIIFQLAQKIGDAAEAAAG